jgi:hypothetical protein
MRGCARHMLPSIAMRGWAAVFVAFVTLHQPDGKPVFVAVKQIEEIAPADQHLHPGAGSSVLVYGIWMAARETPKEIAQMLGPDFVLKAAHRHWVPYPSALVTHAVHRR